MTTVTLRRIGNSLGVVIPKEEVTKLGLHEGDRLDIELRRSAGIETIFGAMAGRLGDLDALLAEIDEDEDA